MTTTWKLVAHAPKKVVQSALLAHDEIEDWDPQLPIAGRELSEDQPDDWVLEAWYPEYPGDAQVEAVASLFSGGAPAIEREELPSADWVELSQQGAQPITAGPFHVRTPGFQPQPDAINFLIPAAQAFGTGQHETTAGCLVMLSELKQRGAHPRNIADIGTGTGLLGFAALALWPMARVTATDIDPVCVPVVEENAALNHIPLGPQRRVGCGISSRRRGEMGPRMSNGMRWTSSPSWRHWSRHLARISPASTAYSPRMQTCARS